MKNLEKLASGKFRQDIISGGLGSWIANGKCLCHQKVVHFGLKFYQNISNRISILGKFLMATLLDYILKGPSFKVF